MDTVESQRVLSVIDEAVESLRLISYITPEVINSADQLGGVLGQDVQDVLQQHAAVLGQLPAEFQPHEVLTTASNLLRVLKNSAGVEAALASLHTSRPPAVLQLLSYAERHRALTVKRLHTTVEEDAATKASLAGLSSKLEAAGAERLQLEHKLRLQRLEQAKATGTLQASYDAAASVLADLRASAAARKAADEAAAAAEKKRADEDFQQQHTQLAAQVAIGEYDAELGARQAEVDAAAAAHAELLANIQRVNAEVGSLRAERLAYEEAQRVAAEAAKQAALAALRLDCAVYMIQNRWKAYKKAKAAAAKAAAKGKKGGGKGGAKAGGSTPSSANKAKKKK